MNGFKTTLLMLLLFLVFMGVGQWLGGQQGLILAFCFALVTNFIGYFFSDKIVLSMYGAKEIGREDAPSIYRAVSNLTQKAGIPMPKIYVIPSESPNAFATGRNPNHAAVVFTQSIVQILNDDELEAVIGHELSHVLHRDILISTIAATMAATITMLAHMLQWAMIFGGVRGRDNERGGNGLEMIAMIILAPIAAMLIQLAVSRSREFAADEGSAKLTGKPLALANALKKLEEGVKVLPMQEATPATAHMFIVNPMRESFLLQLFSTHPSTGRRISRLTQMAQNLNQVYRRR